MKLRTAITILLLSAWAGAQTPAPPPVRQTQPPTAAATGAGGQLGSLGLPLPGGFNPPVGLLDQWWKDPATASELGLTEGQKKQLDAGALAQRLALIDAGADGLKAITQLGALLDAEQLDEAAYKRQIGDLSTVAARLVQTLGDMAITPRRVLTTDQWKKLVALQARKQAASSSPPAARQNVPRDSRPPGSKP